MYDYLDNRFSNENNNPDFMPDPQMSVPDFMPNPSDMSNLASNAGGGEAGGGEGKASITAGGSGGDAGGYVYRNGELTRVRTGDLEYIRRREAMGNPVPGYSLGTPPVMIL